MLYRRRLNRSEAETQRHCNQIRGPWNAFLQFPPIIPTVTRGVIDALCHRCLRKERPVRYDLFIRGNDGRRYPCYRSLSFRHISCLLGIKLLNLGFYVASQAQLPLLFPRGITIIRSRLNVKSFFFRLHLMFLVTVCCH